MTGDELPDDIEIESYPAVEIRLRIEWPAEAVHAFEVATGKKWTSGLILGDRRSFMVYPNDRFSDLVMRLLIELDLLRTRMEQKLNETIKKSGE